MCVTYMTIMVFMLADIHLKQLSLTFLVSKYQILNNLNLIIDYHSQVQFGPRPGADKVSGLV